MAIGNRANINRAVNQAKQRARGLGGATDRASLGKLLQNQAALADLARRQGISVSQLKRNLQS